MGQTDWAPIVGTSIVVGTERVSIRGEGGLYLWLSPGTAEDQIAFGEAGSEGAGLYWVDEPPRTLNRKYRATPEAAAEMMLKEAARLEP